ncbi:lipopolysaccharide-induced tumor necrosis factor-alpha factor homolog [Dunckerocampus dactyliophorus]|uniref:lipopolysaccharide-induced tumor necrosis factor-alpha factor homolog n=1 Tax=Dunckerocampus dactyliophorus TaxID=161453 RepID=UPI002405F062|nr:lipopolysaccharide-induced tumor necrosis factor-alpha factor homolog [Dunckerocampus dactyliophorus]
MSHLGSCGYWSKTKHLSLTGELWRASAAEILLKDDGQAGQDVKIYHVHAPFRAPLPSFPSSFSPGGGPSTQSPPQVSAPPPFTPRTKFVNYETELYRSPALTTCPSCRTQVTTRVTFRVGRHAWLMCLVLALCGLVLGCCLIPLFVKHFKDAHHSCPRCYRVLHVQHRTCCQ